MDIAYAMGAGEAAAQGTPGFFSIQNPMFMIVAMFAVMYFLLIRPQQKKQKEHREMMNNLKKGDRIITSGGLIGRITGLTDTTLTLEIADKVRVKVSRGHIAGLAQAAPQPSAATKNKSESDKKK